MDAFDPVATARAFRAWLKNPDDVLEADVRRIADISEAQWAAVRRNDPSLTAIAVTRQLLALAYDARGRATARAVWLARLAIRVAKDTWEGDANLDAVIETEGDAWREYAACLLDTGEYRMGRLACARAHELYSLIDAGKNAAILCLYEGRILHELGETEEGLATVVRGSNLLRDVHKDEKRYVMGRTIQASILMSRGDYGAAADVLRSVVEPARAMGDMETYAHITHFIGRCMAKLGQIDEAKRVLAEAVKLFQDLRMHNEPPRVRGTIAQLLASAGRYNEAISELYMARAEFLSLQLPVIAALVSLDIADLLIVQERRSEVQKLCTEMIRVFTETHLSRNALAALQHLQSLSERSGVTADAVQRVRTYLELLPSDPDRPFQVA